MSKIFQSPPILKNRRERKLSSNVFLLRCTTFLFFVLIGFALSVVAFLVVDVSETRGDRLGGEDAVAIQRTLLQGVISALQWEGREGRENDTRSICHYGRSNLSSISSGIALSRRGTPFNLLSLDNLERIRECAVLIIDETSVRERRAVPALLQELSNTSTIPFVIVTSVGFDPTFGAVQIFTRGERATIHLNLPWIRGAKIDKDGTVRSFAEVIMEKVGQGKG